MIMREIVPCCAVVAVILANRAPLPLAEVGTPLAPSLSTFPYLSQPGHARFALFSNVDLCDRYGGAEQPDDLPGELALRRSDVEDQGVFVPVRFLDGVELALQQAGGHEMPVSACEAFGDEGVAAAQIDQPNLRPVADDQIAVAPLQGGACDDPGLALGALAVDPGRHSFEPGLAVAACQRNSGVHLCDVGLRMQPIAFLERPAETRGEFLCDSALADARDAHDNQDWRGAAMRTRAVQAMDAGSIGNKDRPGPANEQSALDHPDQPSDPLFQAGRIGDRAEIAV